MQKQLCKFVNLQNPSASSRLQQEIGNLHTVIRIWSEKDRFGPERRLQYIVPADRYQCSPDKCDCSRLVNQRQLTTRIEEDDVNSAAFCLGLRPCTSSSHCQATIANHGFDSFSALDVTGSKQQSRRGVALEDPSIGL